MQIYQKLLSIKGVELIGISNLNDLKGVLERK